MVERIHRIDRLVKQYDRMLFAVRSDSGMIQILREGTRKDVSDFDGDYVSRPFPQFILALTDTWTIHGEPVEWGIEPLSRKLREMDSWNREIYQEFCKERERKEEDQKRMDRNEIRAKAADLRKDFAKATNEINTSTLEKVDPRRNEKWQ